MLHLPQNLRLIRLLADQTQPEFGKQFGASKAMIVSYEKGKANPDELFISRLANYAGVSEKDLLSKPLKEEDIKRKVEKVEKEALISVVNEAVGNYPNVHLSNLSESNKVLADGNKILAEANKTLAEANKTLAEANHVISKNHDELIQLTKMIVSNSMVSPKTQQATFGPEANVVGPGFAQVTPAGSHKKAGK